MNSKAKTSTKTSKTTKKTTDVTSVLYDYGTLVGPKAFNKVKHLAQVTQYIAYTKRTLTYPQYKTRNIDGIVFYRVPRGMLTIAESQREDPDIILTRVHMRLLDYQRLVVRASAKRLEEKHSMLLQMDTGLGKSYVAAGLINRMRVKTCIVVSNKLLRQQMYDDLCRAYTDAGYYPDDSEDLYIPSISLNKNVDADIVIVVINTAVTQKSSFWEKFGLVILDEVHAYCSPTFRDIFWCADFSRYVFGMTATPERLDSMHSIMLLHLGPIQRAVDIYGTLESCKPSNFFGSALKIEYSGPKEYTQDIVNSADVPSPILMAKQFLKDPHRMSMVAKIITQLYEAGRYVYVFCQVKTPLNKLRRRILNCFGETPETKALRDSLYVVTGDTSIDESNAAKDNARIFLTTYNLSSKGLSVKRFDTLMFLTPMKSNMEQICGRVFRKGSDETIPRLIIDIVDIKTRMKKQFYVRKKEYARRGLPITQIKVVYDTEDYTELHAEISRRLAHTNDDSRQAAITKDNNLDMSDNDTTDYNDLADDDEN